MKLIQQQKLVKFVFDFRNKLMKIFTDLNKNHKWKIPDYEETVKELLI